MRVSVLVSILLLCTTTAGAQTQTVLFPGQSGAELRASLKAAYRPASLLNYSGAQDRLMDSVDTTTVGGQKGVVGVYTGYFVPLDGQCSYGACNPGDANQDVFNGGADINVEHTWPRSLLSGNPGPESDMHHLFPTQVAANGDRANYPFAEIPDAQTSKWYRGAPPYTQTAIPTSNIDEYSELRSGTSFEPREDHKGNVARALFYMRTIWDGQVTASFLDDAQQRTLYAWHYADPITQADQDRSARVATFESGKDNPFVLDSTLVRRAFFPEIVVAGEAAPEATALRLTGANPFRGATTLELRLAEAGPVRAEAFDALGRRVALLFDGEASGVLELRLEGAALASGVYAVRVAVGSTVFTQRLVRAR